MTSDTRTPEEIEREIERERAGLTNTLDDLQDKFSVETIARQFSDQFREHGGDIGRSVSEAVKRNPVALALTGAGLAWLMLGDKSGGRDHDDRDRRYGRFEHDDRYDGDCHENDRVGRTGLPSRSAPHMSDARSQQFGSQAAGSPASSRSYYSRQHAATRDLPSWANNDDHDSGSGMGATMRNAASGAGENLAGAASSVSHAASSAAGSVRDAGSTVAEKAKEVGEAVSDAGKSAAHSTYNVAASASDRAAAYRERLAEGTEHLAEEARERIISARESAIEARDAAMSYARRGRDRAADIFEEQPLIAGALAVALGAALGAALPRSRMEDEYLGESSDHLMDEAERIFAEEKEKLGKVAKAATDEAKNIVKEARDDAESMATAAIDKAKESGERITDAAESEAKKQHLGDVKKS